MSLLESVSPTSYSDKIREEITSEIQEEKNLHLDPWEKAKTLFPYQQEFPWEVLPECLIESLKQLARSCATSPLSLPGAAFSIISSCLGGSVSISPKQSWLEPLIIWMADIRPSGSGKTPAANLLCKVLHERQKDADRRYSESVREWEDFNINEKKANFEKKPKRARGYFITNLTLEGLREDLSDNLYGGTICYLEELSSFITSQNQYKDKGDDREAWLTLWSGHPARIVRRDRSISIYSARVNIFGGIQNRIWKEYFGKRNKLFLEDGTIFRFLITYEGDSFYPSTLECWEPFQKDHWENVLKNALEWSDSINKKESHSPIILKLSSEAQKFFIDWNNELKTNMQELPPEIRRFESKLISYCVRLSGICYLLKHFSLSYSAFVEELTRIDIEKGIELCNFYMGHAIEAVEALYRDKEPKKNKTEHALALAKLLPSLKYKFENGYYPIGLLGEDYNKYRKFNNNGKISDKAMGGIARDAGLTVKLVNSNVKGRRSIYCLYWDEKLEKILESTSVTSVNL
jgi:hypothetical protein